MDHGLNAEKNEKIKNFEPGLDPESLGIKTRVLLARAYGRLNISYLDNSRSIKINRIIEH